MKGGCWFQFFNLRKNSIFTQNSLEQKWVIVPQRCIKFEFTAAKRLWFVWFKGMASSWKVLRLKDIAIYTPQVLQLPYSFPFMSRQVKLLLWDCHVVKFNTEILEVTFFSNWFCATGSFTVLIWREGMNSGTPAVDERKALLCHL